MIITCINCNKKFEIDSSLIPENGRLLQCGSCNHKWHYVKEIIEDTRVELKKKEIEIENNQQNYDNEKNIDEETTQISQNTKIIREDVTVNPEKPKKISFLNIILVFIITFVALLIIIDTFQSQLISIIPEFELILYNFYETINDVTLFLKDLF
tara:strand:+ start:119 stop:580 length:462 start_codon:yes stop_codon:yes gene_type:complete